MVGLFALWVLKDMAVYLLLRDVFAPSRTGPESLPGARAIAKEPLAPVGHVVLAGETWRAESLRAEASIPAGAPVIVRGARGLTLLVEAEESVATREAEGGVP